MLKDWVRASPNTAGLVGFSQHNRVMCAQDSVKQRQAHLVQSNNSNNKRNVNNNSTTSAVIMTMDLIGQSFSTSLTQDWCKCLH